MLLATARPLVGVEVAAAVKENQDTHDTLPMELSPAAKAWVQNPPVDVPPDDLRPQRFAEMVLPKTKVLGEESPFPQEKFVGEGGKASSHNEKPGDSGDEPEIPEVVPEVEIEGVSPNKDLFHSTEMVTRQSQMEERQKAMEAQKGEKPEKGDKRKEKKKKELAKKKREEAKARKESIAAAKKATAKAKAAFKKAEKDLGKADGNVKKSGEPKAKAKGRAGKRKASALPEPEAAEQVEQPLQPEQPSDSECPAGDEKKTFARRNRPSRNTPAKRFDGIKEVFLKRVKEHVLFPSSLEACHAHGAK